MKTRCLSAMFFSGLAIAQGLPNLAQPSLVRLFSVRLLHGADALPVPFMPLWATILLAVALWVVVYLMRTKES